ncbi:Cell division protein FtsQ [Caldanaerobius fijiensis DSM 17918]|uniref:Cell division protein FtsQ n=1 Tax=Caldanaerobius fijiensis DSM 17918 TaxID=1121256 RepID=A0A1M4T2A8_9THEO|nr:FtsQ-type POTRA domain-containing protein [Caldanaerobius fijiensis]SHE38545.1 Cell division protein FtsQ [Caldanaerobius fijiensis DSM 17918]
MQKKILKIVFVIILLSVSVYIILGSDYFKIKEIRVEGNKRVPTGEIIKLSGVKVGDLIFQVDKKDIIRRLKSIRYVKNAVVKLKMPDKMILHIVERIPVGLVPYYGSFLKIDDEGVVLEVTKNNDNKLPVLYGVKLKETSLEQKVKPENSVIFKQALQVLKSLDEMHMTNLINEVEINGSTIVMKARPDIEVKVGQADDLYYKLNFLKVILNDLQNKGYKSGTIDLSVKNPTFTPNLIKER